MTANTNTHTFQTSLPVYFTDVARPYDPDPELNTLITDRQENGDCEQQDGTRLCFGQKFTYAANASTWTVWMYMAAENATKASGFRFEPGDRIQTGIVWVPSWTKYPPPPSY